MNANQRFAAACESAAADLLQGKGLRILQRNWRCRLGEIDLIADDGGILVFVEVRGRRRRDFMHPLESLDAGKLLRLQRAAQVYLLAPRWRSRRCRFDVVAVSPPAAGEPAQVEHFTDVLAGDGGTPEAWR